MDADSDTATIILTPAMIEVGNRILSQCPEGLAEQVLIEMLRVAGVSVEKFAPQTKEQTASWQREYLREWAIGLGAK
jgi:hypothetical protein